MSRKDYERIAAILAQHRACNASAPISSTAAAIACDLAEAFANDNPRFDKQRWFEACQSKLRGSLLGGGK